MFPCYRRAYNFLGHADKEDSIENDFLGLNFKGLEAAAIQRASAEGPLQVNDVMDTVMGD